MLTIIIDVAPSLLMLLAGFILGMVFNMHMKNKYKDRI